MSDIRKRIKPLAPDGWQQVADAVREVRDQIRESFGPQQELRVVADETEHSLPNKLLPRGDRLGDWLPPGTRVVLHLGKEGESEYPAVVEPKSDMVTVRLDNSNVVTDFPRKLISKEGEPWTPPKPTDS